MKCKNRLHVGSHEGSTWATEELRGLGEQERETKELA